MANFESNGTETHREKPGAEGVLRTTALVPVQPAHAPRQIFPQPPLAPAFLSAKPDAWTLLRALRRRWLLAMTLGLVAAGIASVVVYMIPATYTGQTFLFLQQRTDKIVSGGQDSEFGTFQRTQAALVRSHFVINRALGKAGVSELGMLRDVRDPVEWLETNLQVDFSQSPEIMRISLSGDDSRDLVVLIQAIADSYLEETTNDEMDGRSKRMQKLKDVSAKYDAELRNKRRYLKDMAEGVGTSNSFVLAFKQQFLFDQLQSRKSLALSTQNELMKLRIDASVDLAHRQANPNPTVPLETVEDEILKHPLIPSMQQKIEQMDTKVKEGIGFYKDGEKNPKVQSLLEQKKNLSQALEAFKQHERGIVADQLKKRMQGNDKATQARVQDQIVKYTEMLKKLEEEIKKLEDNIKAEARTGLDMESVKEDVESADIFARRLREMAESESINLTVPARVMRRQGEVPDVRANLKPEKKMLYAGGAGGAAMVLIFIVVAYWEFLARRIISGDDVVYGLGWKLVGAIPDIPNRHRRPNEVDGAASKHWSSLLTESVDAARTVLLRAAATESVRTVMITSAVAGEGKTSLSCHLAASLARAGRKTLLIDGDLRRPSVHQMFDLPVDPGLAGLLRSDTECNSVIRTTPAPNLWIIPAGQCDSVALQALSQGKIRMLLDELKEQFDFVIVDSSPVLPVVDALEIGQNVDVVIFSLLRDVSRYPNVYAAYERLTSLGIRVIGAVVNGVRREGYGYAYRYYYSYGYTK